RILKVSEKFRYYPNMHTVRMISGKSKCVALLIPSQSLDYFEPKYGNIADINLASATFGVEQELSRNSYYLTLASTDERFIKSKEYLKLYRSRMVDGIIIWGLLSSQQYVHKLIEDKVPLVMIQGAPPALPVSQVVAQDFEGMNMIADHLVSLGHNKISFIPPLQTASVGEERYKGFLAGLKRHGIKPVCISEYAGFDFETGYLSGREILKNSPETTAIAASNDIAALGVMKAAKETGRKVPDDLSVTGADGIYMNELVKLTTYFSPSFEIGATAAKLLRKIIEKKNRAPEKIRIEVKFMPGETTGNISESSRSKIHG
ncbi:MAG: substrate-binding domain-containing protein, partial [Lentisphaerota bacterium]